MDFNNLSFTSSDARVDSSGNHFIGDLDTTLNVTNISTTANNGTIYWFSRHRLDNEPALPAAGAYTTNGGLTYDRSGSGSGIRYLNPNYGGAWNTTASQVSGRTYDLNSSRVIRSQINTASRITDIPAVGEISTSNKGEYFVYATHSDIVLLTTTTNMRFIKHPSDKSFKAERPAILMTSITPEKTNITSADDTPPRAADNIDAVSYTHLTLPTICSV